MASDEQFSLCWNNFHANMSAGFHGLLSRGDLVDVTLAAEGRLLQAHKLVLSVCSPYFQEMFKMNPTQHPIVFLKDVSHSALRDLLQFMYQGEVNVKQEELASFISTAEQLQVKGLTGNQNEESSTPSKPKPTSRPGPRSSQQRQSVMTKLETDLDSKPSSTPVAIKRPNRPSIASNNSSSSQSGPVKRKCVDPLEAGPSGSAKEEFVTIPDEDENNAVAPKMEPEFVNESMWDDDDDGTNNDETNFGEDDSNMEMTGFDGSTTGDGNLTGGAEGGAVGDAQVTWARNSRGYLTMVINGYTFYKRRSGKTTQEWRCSTGGGALNCKARIIRIRDTVMYVKSNRGKPLLVVAGYPFFNRRSTMSTTEWRCTKYPSCMARVITNTLTGEFVRVMINHGHEALTYINNARGKELCIVKGFTFYLQRHMKSSVAWLCTFGSKCKAKVAITVERRLITANFEHDHAAPKFIIRKGVYFKM
ncbi:protein tramtrack, beta isoform isoform X2 [Cydia pomonella]|uniref:protein tramtrack, beta isoform isoform X2 n=1 Tax=Cydia pomonella TaxID=82600 RepID=UPI002ADDF850|nr:protein tramtrack, beta isoform isoform X2 [Cydia pomonella]